MSIVERALQKAQAQAKSSQPQPTAAPPEPSPGNLPEAAVPPAPRPAPRSRPPSEDASITSRDLKQIVEIDVARLREAGRLPPADAVSQTEEEIRRIKWPLLNAIAGRDGALQARNNVILVTSALPSEGKTFVSLNLALSIVRDREMRVILVDGDVARPGLTPALGLENRPGLNDVLEDVNRETSSVTYQTDVEGLFFVPAGKWHDRAPEFFAGSRMPQLIEELSRRVGNGVIIIDSPPLLATNEAQVVTRYVGQLLMVVRADDTEQRAVLDALALVDKSTPVSAVLNRVKASALSRYYGQYYYGGYGQGYSYGRRERTGKGEA